MERAALAAVVARPGDGAVPVIAGAGEPVRDGTTCNNLYESEIFYIDGEEPPAENSAGEDGGAEDRPPAAGYPIVPMDLSGSPGKDELLVRENETDFAPDPEALRDAPYPVAPSGCDGPRVLILHTHGTESFSENGRSYDDETSFRSQDVEKNVVAVGEVICEELRAAGVECVHCEVMHDTYDFYGSYDRAKDSILSYLEKYPSIEYVLDVHRDAIIRGNGDMVAPLVDTPEGPSAQVMLVVGTDAFGADHPAWRDNLNVACKLQTELNSGYPLARPLNIRGASFNEQFRTGSLLVEIGSSGNTLEEAGLAGRLFARAFVRMLSRYTGTPAPAE